MKLDEIIIRDPFVLVDNGTYYMYGTRADSAWGTMDGFDCYTSKDLEDWSGPYEIFHSPEGFWADHSFWAPECYKHDGTYYFFATLGRREGKKSVNLLVADDPRGPFEFAGTLTDRRAACIDGTLYWEDGTPYLVYSHSLEDVPAGDMDAVELSPDLSEAVGEPFTLFRAKDASWNVPVPFAKAEFGIDGPAFFSDGPFLHRMGDGRLVMLWSSWAGSGYGVGQAVSSDGTIHGAWTHAAAPVLEQGGHGMLFEGPDGGLLYTIHVQKEGEREHPVFIEMREGRDGLEVVGD